MNFLKLTINVIFAILIIANVFVAPLFDLNVQPLDLHLLFFLGLLNNFLNLLFFNFGRLNCDGFMNLLIFFSDFDLGHFLVLV